MRLVKNRNAFTLVEMVIVVAIITFISAVVVFPAYKRFVARNNVRAGILKLLIIKKAIEKVGQECGGIPIRTVGGNFSELTALWDSQSGDLFMAPADTKCDGASLKDFLPGYPLNPACTYNDSDCLSSNARSDNFTSMFVKYDGGPCSHTGGSAQDTGWNYVLIEGTADLPPGPNGEIRIQPVSIPVYCANVLGYGDEVITIVVNGAGNVNLTNGVADGAGVYSPENAAGAELPNACVNGAWCRIDSDSGVQDGCCGGPGGLGFKY